MRELLLCLVNGSLFIGHAGFGSWLLNIITDWFLQTLFVEHLLWEISGEAAGEVREAQRTLARHVTPSFNYAHCFPDFLF